jgi:hypothetical protein
MLPASEPTLSHSRQCARQVKFSLGAGGLAEKVPADQEVGRLTKMSGFCRDGSREVDWPPRKPARSPNHKGRRGASTQLMATGPCGCGSEGSRRGGLERALVADAPSRCDQVDLIAFACGSPRGLAGSGQCAAQREGTSAPAYESHERPAVRRGGMG